MWMLIFNHTPNQIFCEEMNTSLGYGTMHRNCSKNNEIIRKILIIMKITYYHIHNTFCDLCKMIFDFCTFIIICMKVAASILTIFFVFKFHEKIFYRKNTIPKPKNTYVPGHV